MDANLTMKVHLKVGDKSSDYAKLLKQIDMYENDKPCERRPRSQNEKYRRAFQVAQMLAALASDDQRVRQLKALEDT